MSKIYYMEQQSRKRINRKRPRLYTPDSFYIPISLSREIERVAALRYGGNKSALVTEALCQALDFIPQEVTEQQTA